MGLEKLSAHASVLIFALNNRPAALPVHHFSFSKELRLDGDVGRIGGEGEGGRGMRETYSRHAGYF